MDSHCRRGDSRYSGCAPPFETEEYKQQINDDFVSFLVSSLLLAVELFIKT